MFTRTVSGEGKMSMQNRTIALSARLLAFTLFLPLAACHRSEGNTTAVASTKTSASLDEAARQFDYSEQSRFSPEVFKRKVKFALANFYDYEVEVRRDGLGSIACPIFEHSNQVVATVGLLMPSSAIGDPPPRALVQSLKECAAKISAALGSTAWRREHR